MEPFIESDKIGRKIRSIRQHSGLTQEMLAELVAVSPQQIQKYETGRTKITTDRLQQLARALQVPVTAFFDSSGKTLTLNGLEEEFVLALRRVRNRRLHDSLYEILDGLAGD